MKRSSWILIILFLLAFSASACKQNKEAAPPEPEVSAPAELPELLPPDSVPPAHPPMQTSAPKTVAVPTEVQGMWESVVLHIEDKTHQTSLDQTIPLHTDYQIPDSELTVQVGDFLPQFSMGESRITSLSNEAKNPALKIIVLKKGEEVFNGWLFERFPEMHPFQDDRFAITLVGYNAKAAP